jgi:putative DNA primase/helicase
LDLVIASLLRTVRRDELPELTQAEAGEFLAEAKEALTSMGWSVVGDRVERAARAVSGFTSNGHTGEDVSQPEYLRDYQGSGIGVADVRAELIEEVKAALRAIDPDLDRADWIAIGCALAKEFGDDGFALWDEWSSNGRKYKPREMAGQWRSIVSRDGYAYNIETVFWHANQADPGWRHADLPFNDEATVDVDMDAPYLAEPGAAGKPQFVMFPTAEDKPQAEQKQNEEPAAALERPIYYDQPTAFGVAYSLWGKPKDFIPPYRYAFGADGSKIVNIHNGHWYDYAAREGGTLRDLMKKAEREASANAALTSVCVADIEAKRYNWLWPRRIARGKLTMIAGMPDTNKSTLTLWLASACTREWALPGGGTAPNGNIIIFTTEDDVADTVRPRLEAAGGDVARVHVVKSVRENGRERGFDLTSDINKLRAKINEVGGVVLVIIDPVSAYMGRPGKLDSYRSTDVRGTLSPLMVLAEETEVAIVGIDHLNKSGGNQALLRMLGSVAFAAAPRSVYLVVRDEVDDAKRYFLPAKNNIAKERTGLAFKIVEKQAPYPINEPYPVVEWLDEEVTMTADEALAQQRDGRRSEAAELAKTIIAEMLANGPKLQTEVKAKAAERGISPNSLQTAKKAMAIASTHTGSGPNGKWWWSLPGQPRPM